MAIQKTKLSVNLNKIALLRNARPLDIPKLPATVQIVLQQTQASGITLHPRPDERHIRYQDVLQISQLIHSYNKIHPYPKEINIEGNPFHGKYLEIIEKVQPNQCTLVPDEPNQSTSNQGWKKSKHLTLLPPIIARLKKQKIRVSLFLDAEVSHLREIIQLKPDAIELYTQPYTEFFEKLQKAYYQSVGFTDNNGVENYPKSINVSDEIKSLPEYTNLIECLKKYQQCAEIICEHGILLHAGHDLNLNNLPLFLKSIKNIHEISIGHALIADSIFWGLKTSVDKYMKLLV